MILGRIDRNIVPMVITQDQDYVDFICENLAQTIEISYQVFELFGEPEEGFDPFE